MNTLNVKQLISLVALPFLIFYLVSNWQSSRAIALGRQTQRPPQVLQNAFKKLSLNTQKLQIQAQAQLKTGGLTRRSELSKFLAGVLTSAVTSPKSILYSAPQGIGVYYDWQKIGVEMSRVSATLTVDLDTLLLDYMRTTQHQDKVDSIRPAP